jgi:hypothetical protein
VGTVLTLPPVIADRFKITPSYSIAPWWGSYDVGQDSSTATFLGGGDVRDRNRTDLVVDDGRISWLRDLSLVTSRRGQAR